MSEGQQLPPLLQDAPIAEFKDTPARVQYIQCGVLLAGGLIAALLWNTATVEDGLFYFGGAGLSVVVALITTWVLHQKYGSTVGLLHFADRVVLFQDDKPIELLFDKLQAFSASWTDVYVNGVYSTSSVRMSFDMEGAFKVHQYESSATDGTIKYEQLQALQTDASNVIAGRMRETMLAEGSVPWTAQMTLSTSGLEFKKNGVGETQLIPYNELGKWEVDSGTFKLAFGDDRRPTVKEPVSQTNFFPGLMLFAELYKEFSLRRDILPEEYAEQDERFAEALV